MSRAPAIPADTRRGRRWRPTRATPPGCRPMPAPARPMCWRSASSGCCSQAARRAASCASPSPRRRRPIWPSACSRPCRNGPRSTTRRWPTPSPRPARRARTRKPARFRAKTVRPRGGDAGRTEDPDAARLLRARAARRARSRPMSRRAFVVVEDVEQQILVARRAPRDAGARGTTTTRASAPRWRVSRRTRASSSTSCSAQALRAPRPLPRPKRRSALRAALGTDAPATRRELAPRNAGRRHRAGALAGFRRLPGRQARQRTRKGELFRAAEAHCAAGRRDEALANLSAVFFTDKGARRRQDAARQWPRQRRGPTCSRSLTASSSARARCAKKSRRRETAERSIALSVIVNAILDRYEALKAERADARFRRSDRPARAPC